jgi:GT2 family glycosyltransferase
MQERPRTSGGDGHASSAPQGIAPQGIAPSIAQGVPKIWNLGGNVLLVACDVPNRPRAAPRLELADGGSLSPLTSLRLPLARGGTRLLWAFRRPANNKSGDGGTILRAFTGLLAARQVAVPAAGAIAPADLAALLADLAPAGRIPFVSGVLGVWSSVFKLRRNQAFVRSVDRMAVALASSPGVATAVAGLAADHILVRTVLAPALGDVQAVYRVTPKGIDALQHQWHIAAGVARERLVHLVAPGKAGESARFIVIGARGIAVRQSTPVRALPALSRWWGGETEKRDGLREFVVRALAAGSETALETRHAAAIEFQLRSPLKARQVSGRGGLPSAAVEIAITGKSGLFVAGWFHDPGRFVTGLVAETETDAVTPVAWHCFPRIAKAGVDDAVVVTGFVGFASASRAETPILQPRFRLMLASGSSQQLVPPPQPADPVERRARILRAVPPEFLSETVMAECLAPALGDLQAGIRASVAPPDVETIGEPLDHPAVSVVIPLYRNLEFLKAQIATFAADRSFAVDAELVYVLDSPEQAAAVRQMLQGLNLLYGIPFRLAVMRRNSGYAAACNAGARIARGEILAMVNSDVIPAGPGWLDRLVEPFAASAAITITGPKLLFDDGSIQHAGMYFARNHFGHWLNHHFYKGYPRDFTAATVARLVPGVTGACMLVRKAAFDQVGGFTEDYVIGDYEDSDLCLKIRDAGGDIAYVPSAELYHFERQSIRQSEDYMRGSADRYNAWLHAGRWGEAMDALMTAFRQPPHKPSPLRSAA